MSGGDVEDAIALGGRRDALVRFVRLNLSETCVREVVAEVLVRVGALSVDG